MLYFKHLTQITKILKQRRAYAFCSNFYTSKGPSIQYDNDISQTRQTDSKGRLLPVDDTSIIAEVNDKYGLEQIRDPNKILTHLKQVQYSYPINELVYFVRHLVHIQEVHGVKCIGNNNFKELLMHIKFVLSENQHEKWPYIGSLAYCFDKLEVNDKELWQLMEYKINEDDYYTNFAESVYAIQGFTRLPLIYYGLKPEIVQEKIDNVYKRLERIMRLTIWEVNVAHYHKLCVALAQVNRFDQETFAKLEQHILTNLSLDYSTRMMVDILFSFAKGQQGSKDFYDSLQYVIFKGHMFKTNYFLQSKVELGYDGYLVSGLMGVYKEAQERHYELQLHPDFKAYIHNLVTNKKCRYTLESAVNTLYLLPSFNFEEYQSIYSNILDKITQLDGQFRVQDVLLFYQWIENTVQNSNQLPIKAMINVENNIHKYADQMLIDDLIMILEYLYKRPKFIQLDPQKLSDKLMKMFESNITYMTGAQMDYFSKLFLSYIETHQCDKQLEKKVNDIQLLRKYQMKQIGQDKFKQIDQK